MDTLSSSGDSSSFLPSSSSTVPPSSSSTTPSLTSSSTLVSSIAPVSSTSPTSSEQSSSAQITSTSLSTATVTLTISGSTTASLSVISSIVTPSNNGSSSLSTGAKIGIGVGCGVGGGAILIGLVALFCVRFARKRKLAYTPGDDEIKWPAAEQEASTLFPAAVRPTGGAGMLNRDTSMRSTAAGTAYGGVSYNGATPNGSAMQHPSTYEGHHGTPYGYNSSGTAATETYESEGYEGLQQPLMSQGTHYSEYGSSGAGHPERAYSVVERQVGGQISSQGHTEGLSSPYEGYSPSEYSTNTNLNRGTSIASRPGPLHLVNAER